MSDVTRRPKSRETKTQTVFNSYYRVHPEDRQTFIDAVAEHIPLTEMMPGCVYYVFAADILDPNTFHLSEAWVDEATIAQHHQSAIFQQALHDVVSAVRILDHQGQRYEVRTHSDGSPPGYSDTE